MLSFQIDQTITSKELQFHCRRATRPAPQIKLMIEEALKTFQLATDNLGTPLLDAKKTQEIWQQQQRHLPCLQDPEGTQLYTRTGYLRKGGVLLPMYRCARGSSSLESFHYHLARFIPGKILQPRSLVMHYIGTPKVCFKCSRNSSVNRVGDDNLSTSLFFI